MQFLQVPNPFWKHFVPHFLAKEPIHEISHPEFLSAIEKVKSSRSPEEALEISFEIITSRYQGKRFHTYIFLWKAFQRDPNHLWKRTEFLHCTHLNYLLRILLIKSEWFREKDVRIAYSAIWYLSVHQYLQVSLPGSDENIQHKTLAVDPWLHAFGGQLGEFGHGFGKRRLSRNHIVI